MVAQFEPVAAGEERFRMVVNMAPGQVGTLTDERVDRSTLQQRSSMSPSAGI